MARDSPGMDCATCFAMSLCGVAVIGFSGRIIIDVTGNPLHHVDAYELVRKRAAAAGIKTSIGNHSFRATGITVFRKLGGSLENAALMANHASTRTTQLYDRRSDDVTLDEVERIYFR
jgi:site-specific recombinase XerD